MCKIGDILVIYNPTVNNKPIGRHAFIVLDDSNGVVSGMFEYDFISLLLTSYKDNDEARKERLSKWEGNLHITKADKILYSENSNIDNRNSFVEANNFFYFSKDKISFKKIGQIDPDVFEIIIEFIEELNKKGVVFNRIIDKARQIEPLTE